jgi:hypothetical protein
VIERGKSREGDGSTTIGDAIFSVAGVQYERERRVAQALSPGLVNTVVE